MNSYGVPGKIYLRLRTVHADPGSDQSVYELWIVYDQIGIQIEYEGLYDLPEQQSTEIEVCPTFDKLKYVTLLLEAPADESDSLEIDNLLYGSKFSVETQLLEGTLEPIEGATGLTESEFFELFQLSEEENCFYSLISVWQ